jgi:hypothetical protein
MHTRIGRVIKNTDLAALASTLLTTLVAVLPLLFLVLAVSTAYAIGTQGLTFSLGGSIVALRKGDRFTIAVTPAQLGNVNTLVLANPLPVALRTATDVNLWLYTQKDVEVPLNRAGYDPITNYSVDASNGITVRSGIVLYDPAFVDNSGAQIPLTLIDGTMYVQYRAWLPDLSGQVRSVATTSDLATVSGAIDPDNPLKNALSKALLGAAGVPITYIGVSDPSDSTSWAKAIARLDGRDDVYDIVPLTYDPAIINLFVAHADSQSSPESAHERRVVIGLVPSLSEMLVGQATSTDGGVVLATLGDDPNTSGTQYTLFTIPADNGKVITRGVLPGDTVRYAYTTSFGQPVYSTYTVASVISEYSFTVVGGAAAAVTTPQRLEIWHANSIDEIVTDLVDQATAYADQRVIAVWSDLIGLTARSTETYYIAAARYKYRKNHTTHNPKNCREKHSEPFVECRTHVFGERKLGQSLIHTFLLMAYFLKHSNQKAYQTNLLWSIQKPAHGAGLVSVMCGYFLGAGSTFTTRVRRRLP